MTVKNQRDIEGISTAGAIVAKIGQELSNYVRAGISTLEIENQARNLMTQYKVTPLFLGYRGYPASICVSLNSEVVHGIPNKNKIIKPGDLVSIDIGVVYDGYCGDYAITVGVGKVNPIAKKLIQVGQEALDRAIRSSIVDKQVGDISATIQSYVEAHGLSVIRDFSGHGIGKKMHEFPQIPNFGSYHCGPYLHSGMVLALETMVTAGDWPVRFLDDGWTAVTVDGSLSTHFEHMIMLTPNGPELLTCSDKCPVLN